MRGATYAFTSVVETRSNSGPRGMTSCESEMCSTSGNSSSTISRVRRSCAGFTNENRYMTAIDRDAELLQPLHAAPHRVLVEREQRLALEVHALAGSGSARAGGRSGSGPGSSGPRSPPCGSGAARSRRGDPRSRAGRSARRSSRSSCCRRSSCRARGCRDRGRTRPSSIPKRIGELLQAVHHARRLVVEGASASCRARSRPRV